MLVLHPGLVESLQADALLPPIHPREQMQHDRDHATENGATKEKKKRMREIARRNRTNPGPGETDSRLDDGGGAPGHRSRGSRFDLGSPKPELRVRSAFATKEEEEIRITRKYE